MNSPRTAPPPTGADMLRLGGLAALAAVLVSPIRHYAGPMKKVNVAKIEEDSFPLSTFPMFSEDRKGRVIVPHVVGFTADDDRIVPHYTHYGAGGLNQVRKQISRDVRQGRAVEVAQRYADSLAGPHEDEGSTELEWARLRQREQQIVRVEVVRSRFVFDDWFAGDRSPAKESVFARCDVGGTAQAERGRQQHRRRKDA